MMGSRGQAISEIQAILKLHEKDKAFKGAIQSFKTAGEAASKREDEAMKAVVKAEEAEKKLSSKQAALTRREKALKKREDDHKAFVDEMADQAIVLQEEKDRHRTEIALAEQELENQAKDLREREAKLAAARNELIKDRQKVEKDKAWYDREIARVRGVLTPAA